MNSEIIKVNINLDKKDALDEIIRQSEEMEEFYTIYVVDDADVLQGILSIKSIIKARSRRPRDATWWMKRFYVRKSRPRPGGRSRPDIAIQPHHHPSGGR
jgi:Mg/Co/Ni transporter MgtE